MEHTEERQGRKNNASVVMARLAQIFVLSVLSLLGVDPAIMTAPKLGGRSYGFLHSFIDAAILS